MAEFWERLINAVYRRTPAGKHLAQLPLSFRAAQESFLLALLDQPRYRDPKHLARFEHQVYSQNGEDGVIAEIFRRIGAPGKTFLEIGVGDGLENNTVFLLSQGWNGWWIDGDANAMRNLRQTFARPLSDSTLRLHEMFVTAENIENKLQEAGVPDELDLFSLDVDRNTYWIWDALPKLRAKVVVVEYNATMPPAMDWKIKYAGNLTWDGSFGFGASLKAFEELGRARGYNLVYCDLTGVNAFFVRKDLCGDHFMSPFDSLTHYEPPRLWLQRVSGHPRSLGMFKGDQ